MLTSKPLCLCGCGRVVKRAFNRYYTTACVPRSRRSEGGMKSRRAFSLNRKARLFGELLKRLEGVRVSRGDLIALLDAAYQRGWDNGYHTSEGKWVRRDRKAEREAA